jgi:predicted Fe-Mo cluster-binding NifX family protein
MKIAITAEKAELESALDPRFGRAKIFAIHDTDSGTTEFANNEQNLNAPSGAGIQAAANIAKLGVQVLITGNCGPKAYKTLDAAKIKIIIGASGTVNDVIEKFKRGDFEYADAANVEGHW